MLSDIFGSFIEHLKTYFNGFVQGLYSNTYIQAFDLGRPTPFLINSESEIVVPFSDHCLPPIHPPEYSPALGILISVHTGITPQITMLHPYRDGAGENLDDPPVDDMKHYDSLQLNRNRKHAVNVTPSMRRKRMHYFSPIALEADTFCDFCSHPLYGLGLSSDSQRCTVCHMTCHWACKEHVRIGCQLISQSKLRDDAPETTELMAITQDTSSHTVENGVEDNQDLQKPAIKEIGNTPNEQLSQFGSNRPTARLLRQSTNVDQFKRPNKTRLAVRHSFLAGQCSDAPLSARISYDFSSLDKEAIRAYDIRVRDWSTSAIDSSIAEKSSTSTTGTPTAPSSPPHPPQGLSSLANTSQTGSGGVPKDEEQAQSVSPTPRSTSSSSCSSTGSGSGLASVMQTTECFMRNNSDRQQPKFQHKHSFPAPSVPLVSSTVGPRNTLPWADKELEKRIAIFNTNEFGLKASKPPTISAGDCDGQVRIHINLLRPIHMLFNSRPTSIFDVVGSSEDRDEVGEKLDEFGQASAFQTTENVISGAGYEGLRSNRVTDGSTYYSPPKSAVTAAPVPFEPSNVTLRRRRKNQLTSKSDQFWVPRGSTKLLHVRLSTTALRVISALLECFQIEENPQKFALYEHTIEGDQEVSVRKLFDDESPLGLLLCWVEPGVCDFNQILGIKRLVLQENETGDIEWNRFTVAELNTFLAILNQEEANYRNRIQLKFERRCKEIQRLLALREREAERDREPPGETPVELEETWVGEEAGVGEVAKTGEQNQCDVTGTASFAETDIVTLKRPTKVVLSPVIDNSNHGNQARASPPPSVASSSQNEQTGLEAAEDGLQTLAIDQVDQQPTKLQMKQQKKAEKERLKAEKKATKQRGQGSFKGFGWFGNLGLSKAQNPSSNSETTRKS